MLTQTRFTRLAAFVLWVACAAYTAPFVTRGWIAHDEGTIGQSAERTLRGEIPHRDFDEVYTGGLSYLDAAAMRVSGVNLLAPRWMLFGCFMAFVAAASNIAWRLTPGWGAMITVALVVAWSVPNYFAGLPSWYTLFFATFGLLALLRHLDTGHRAWLVVAGGWGGVSILMKITGLYYVLASLLFLVYLEQFQAPVRVVPGAPRSRFWLVLATPVVILFLLIPRGFWAAIARPQFLPVFLPALVVSIFVIWRERAAGRGSVVARTRSLFTLMWPFLLGVALPTGAFLLWYWHNGAVDDLMRGVFVLPTRRLTEASIDPPPITVLGLALPYFVLLVARQPSGPRRRWLLPTLLALGLGMLVYASTMPMPYRVTWAIVRSVPLLAAGTLVWMLRERNVDASWPPPQRAGAVLLVVMSAFLALVQFPYTTPTYFCYGAPIAVLAIAALVAGQPQAPRHAHAVVAIFFLAFAIVFVNRSYGWNLGTAFIPYAPQGRLDIDRGGLRVPAEDANVYEELVRVLRQHAAGGTIYAGPDCPEVYFLSGFQNPTRIIFEFLTPDQLDVPWTSALLARAPIRAVVINTAPLFSKPFEPAVLALLEQRFPSSRRIGRFVVRFQ
ncbi:MAG: hypothetical protein ABI634_19535 [Acidobacteriota bacterium]